MWSSTLQHAARWQAGHSCCYATQQPTFHEPTHPRPLPGGWSLPTSRIAGGRCRLGRMGRPLPGCPEGTNENSPAFQRRVSEPKRNESRQGRQKVFRSWHVFFRRYRAPTCWLAVVPAMNRSAIIGRPFGTRGRAGGFPALKRRAILKMSPRTRNVANAFSVFPSSKQPDSLPMLSRSFRRHGVQPGRCGTHSAQEGSKRSSASLQFPSWEGLGVGSWSQCMRES